MYFYLRPERKESGQVNVLFGPFLIPRNALLKHHHDISNRRQLNESDYENLMQATEELTFYQCPFRSLDTEVEFRDEVSSIEYYEASNINKSSFTLNQWREYLCINKSQHNNYLTGRSKINGLLAIKIIDLLIPHSYVLERTAFALSNYSIGGVDVKDMSMQEFGQSSMELLDALKNGRDILLNFYWRCRSHVDLMQTYVYIKTAEERESRELIFSEWYRCPEYDAYSTTHSTSTIAGKKASRAKVMGLINLIKKYKDAEMTEGQRLSTQQMIQDGLSSLGHTGGKLTSDESLKFMEDILGLRHDNEGLTHKGFTHASAGVLYPIVDDPSDEDLGFNLLS